MLGNKNYIRLPDVVGRGYKDFWKFKGRYRVIKGSRSSKKSKTTALWIIEKMMEHPEANALVVRKVYRTLKDSCYTELKWAINRFGVASYWECRENPLEITYKPTGQKIFFRGLDDPLKITSITVEKGNLCWGWIEEAYEVTNEADFDMLDESIRGEVAEGLWKMWTLTLNPWNEKHWIKRRFFDANDPNIMAKTTNYMQNEWLDDADKQVFVDMQKNNPRRYQVAGLGNWGIVDGLVFENWREEEFDHTSEEFKKQHPNLESVFGLDFGYTIDPSALFCGLVDIKNKKIYVFDEMYEKGLSNAKIYKKIYNMGYAKERIRADSSEPKSIDELRDLGLYGIRAARRGNDSISHGIQYIQNFEIIIHPRCVNTLTEISNYTFAEDRLGNKINKPIDDFNHCMDAFRYAMEDLMLGSAYSFY